MGLLSNSSPTPNSCLKPPSLGELCVTTHGKLRPFFVFQVFHCPSCEAFTVAPLGSQAPKPRKAKGSGSSLHAEDAQEQKQVPPSQGESAEAVAVGENASNSNSNSSSKSSNSSGKEEQVAAADGIRLKYKAASLPEGVATQCSECGGRVLLGGPIYSGPYYDPVSFL